MDTNSQMTGLIDYIRRKIVGWNVPIINWLDTVAISEMARKNQYILRKKYVIIQLFSRIRDISLFFLQIFITRERGLKI